MKHIVWFSCGAASAITAKLVLDTPNLVLANIFLANEHADNQRFADDCERWFGKEIIRLSSPDYSDCWDVWERTRYLNGPKGARCTTELKKKVRQAFQAHDDVQYFGFTVDEQKRAERFKANNPEIDARFPLIEHGYTKADCFLQLTQAHILLPEMYRLGYHNANCVGCVKGGMGYWNKIREDFPEVFQRMSELEDKLGRTVINGTALKVLEPARGRHTDLELPDCGLFCGESY